MMGRGCWWNEMKCELYIEMQGCIKQNVVRYVVDMKVCTLFSKKTVLALKNVFKRVHNNFMPIEQLKKRNKKVQYD